MLTRSNTGGGGNPLATRFMEDMMDDFFEGGGQGFGGMMPFRMPDTSSMMTAPTFPRRAM